MQKSWRSRYLARMVDSVSRKAPPVSAPRPRIFPYWLIENTREKPVHRLVPKVPTPVAATPDKPKAPAKQTNWVFIKR
jgi:hypothetical protein